MKCGLVARPDFRLPVTLGLAALSIRVAAFFLSFEVPGDGPARASAAHAWSLAPRLYVMVLPFNYLAGMFAWLVPDPLISTRILNLLLGSLTIPLFYGLIRHIYGTWVAAFSASILVFLPLHVGLSVTSLTEVTFLFLVIAALFFFLQALVEQHHRRLFLVSAVLFLCLAEVTRYEAWVLIPVFLLYYLLVTGRLLPCLGIAVVVSAFPIAHTLGNYLYTGQALWGFSLAVQGTEGGPVPMTLPHAIYKLATEVVVQMSWLLPSLALAGLVLQFIMHWRHYHAHPEPLFYAAVFGLYGLTTIVFTMARGASIWERYLLFGLVIGLPYAALPFEYVAKPRVRALAAVSVILLSVILAPSVVLAPRIKLPQIYITRQRPREVEEVAIWVRNSEYRNSSILLTKMDWKCTYFLLYAPEFYSRSLEFSFWYSDAELSDFIRRQKPALLITSEGDLTYQRHVAAFLPKVIRDSDLVYVAGTIRIYNISG